jgi:hypothetical protein
VPSHSSRHHIPILSIFEDALNDAEEKIKARMDPQHKASLPQPQSGDDDRYTVVNKHPDDLPGESPAASAKRERAKQALIAMLPSYDQLTKILNSNGEWWQTWRRKCSGTSGPDQTLAQFAAQALTNGNIAAVGTVVLAVGICSSAEDNDVERYIEAVDRWVLCDDEYAASLEGMELLILKSKWFADVGQPRKAWICHRKGLMYAQLMGLHRKRTTSMAHESIWWGLYHGDRFLSLLLGLPYGISDSHCDLKMPDFGGEYLHPLAFINNVAKLAGRVIDRNQGVAEQSFAWALQLDQELEDLWKKLDPAWVDYSELLATPEANAAELRERLMAQIVYHQIRVYLHLPFMLKSATNSRFMYSRTACLNGSREVLRLYQALRAGTTQPLYECKAVDFIGFTSAVLIQIGLFNFGSMDPKTFKDVEADTRLIEISIDIFRRASSEKGGKVALQSAQVLEKMQGKFKSGCGSKSNSGAGPCDDGECDDMVIPYFGTISIRRGGQAVSHKQMPPIPSAASSPCANTSSRSASISTTQQKQSQQQQQQQAAALYTPTSEKSSSIFSHPQAPLTLTPQSSLSPNATAFAAALDPSPFVSYDGFYNWTTLCAEDMSNPALSTVGVDLTSPNPTSTSTSTATGVGGIGGSGISSAVNDDSMSNFPLPTNNFSWQHMPMDIDQDWSWFLNDSQTQGQGVGMSGAGGGGAHQQQQQQQQQQQGVGLGQDMFSTGGFTGFG